MVFVIILLVGYAINGTSLYEYASVKTYTEKFRLNITW